MRLKSTIVVFALAFLVSPTACTSSERSTVESASTPPPAADEATLEPGLTAVSNEGYRFTGGRGAHGIVDTFRATLRKVSALPCDVLISTHPGATGMDEKLAARAGDRLAPGATGDPFVDANACAALAERSMKALEDRVAEETTP